MLVAKSNYIRKLILESNESELTRIDLSDMPGGPAIFEKTAKFCYGVNFEITVNNVAVLRCAAEFLEMTDQFCENNLAGRTEEFLTKVAFFTLTGAVTVLKSCRNLLPYADDINIVKRCVEAVSAKACSEANFPSCSPPNWWTEELAVLDMDFFTRVIAAMKQRGAKTLTVATALITYAERALRDLVRDHTGNGIRSSDSGDSDSRSKQRKLLESIVDLFPAEKGAFPIHFLCCILRCAIHLRASTACKTELEKRISSTFEHVTVDDLLVLSFTYDGERLFDLESVRRIISGFAENQRSNGVFTTGDSKEPCSSAMQRVAKTVDAYLGEIAEHGDLSISKFNGIAVLIPKSARKVDDDLYRAVDIYLKVSNLTVFSRLEAVNERKQQRLTVYLLFLAGASEVGWDRERESVQRDGSVETFIRGACARVAEQAFAGADCAACALLRPVAAAERRGGAWSGEGEKWASYGRFVGERERGVENGVTEDEDVHFWFAE